MIETVKVLLEPEAGAFYATAPAPWNERQKGATKEEALQNLLRALQARIARGAEEVEINAEELPPSVETPHPLAEFAGDLQGSPLFAGWVAEMQAYRTEREKELLSE